MATPAALYTLTAPALAAFQAALIGRVSSSGVCDVAAWMRLCLERVD